MPSSSSQVSLGHRCGELGGVWLPYGLPRRESSNFHTDGGLFISPARPRFWRRTQVARCDLELGGFGSTKQPLGRRGASVLHASLAADSPHWSNPAREVGQSDGDP